MLPVFVKGHITFELEGETFEFLNQHVSAWGCSGLRWNAPLNLADVVGKTIVTQVRILTSDAFAFHSDAKIVREYTSLSEQIGLRFALDAKTKEKLSEIVGRVGYLPTEYVRKYPRIPSSIAVQTFPTRAQVMPLAVGLQAGAPAQDLPIVFDVTNLSPNGVLLSTENQAAAGLNPKDRLDIILEPRGWFPVPIRMEGVICRISDEIHPLSLNTVRSLGVKFTRMDDLNRSAFLDLLKDILERIKSLGGRTG